MDYPSDYDERLVKAITNGHCCECHGDISEGSWHWRFSGFWDHEFKVYRMHRTCRRICSNMCLAMHGELPAIGEMVEATTETCREQDYAWPSWWPRFTRCISRRELADWIARYGDRLCYHLAGWRWS